MRKLNGITINGEYLGNSVVINGMFRAICTISPIIMRNFVLMINKIDFLDEAVKISNFNCDNYKNSIDIEFKNETSQGIASLYFELEQGMPVLSDCKLIVENDEYEYEYDAETLSIDEPDSYEVENDEEELLQQARSDEQENIEQKEDTIKKEQIDDIESDTSPEQNEIITPKTADTKDKRTKIPENDDIVNDAYDSENPSEYKPDIMGQSSDEKKTKISKKAEKNCLSEYSDNVIEDDEFKKQEDDTINETNSDNRPKPIKRLKKPNMRRKNRPNEHGEDDSSRKYPEEFNENDYEEEYDDNNVDFSDSGEVSKEISSSGHRQNPHKNRRNPKNTHDNYFNEINDSNQSFTDEEFSLDFSDDNTVFSDFNESNESSDDNFSFEETKPIPRNKSKKQKKQARPTNIDFDDTVFDLNNDESTDNIEDDEESDEQFYKNAMKLSSNMKQCTIIAKTIKIEASNFDNLPDGLHPKNNMNSNMLPTGAGMGDIQYSNQYGMGGGMPGGMGGEMPGGMGGGMPGGMGGGMPGGMGGGMPGGYPMNNVEAFQYQMAALQAQMEMLRQQSESKSLMTLDQFKAQQKAMEEVQEQKRRQNFRIVGSKEHIRASALNGGVYVSGKKIYKWGDTRTLND